MGNPLHLIVQIQPHPAGSRYKQIPYYWRDCRERWAEAANPD